jgi:hypothetical protein
MDRPKIVTWIAVLAAVVGLGLGIGWLATRSTPLPPTQNTVESSAPNVGNKPEPRVSEPRHTVRPVERPAQVAASEETPTAEPDPMPATISTNWEDRLDEILGSEDDDTNKVQQLFAMFPTLPAEGQDEIARHLSNLVEDENYSQLGQLAIDPKLPSEVLDTLLADLLNRPNATKLPAFLDIAFTPDHPKAEEAKELLELYLEPEEGMAQDKATWQKKLNEWLKENPD